MASRDEADGRVRAVVDAVRPSVDGGRFAAKRVLGDEMIVEADCFTDGHDVVRAMLRATRLIKSDRKYAIDFLKGPWVDLGKNADQIAARVYDVAGPDFLENGLVSEEVQRQMIADASVRIKPKQPVLPEQVFDFSIVRKIGATLK